MSEFQPPPPSSQPSLIDPSAEAHAFANNFDQASSEFRPPERGAGDSPLLDPTIAGEIQAFATNQDQERRHAAQIHGMRMSHSNLLLLLAVLWIFVIFVVVLLQGFGQWFTPIPSGFEYLPFKLSDTLLITFITTTTGTVLGLYGIAAYWLYGKPKPPAKLTAKDKKK
ncbi:hypothetical protein ACU7AI_15155 [Pseudomonas aeruginosa]